MKAKPTKAKPKRKSKGKRHAAHAESFQKIADALRSSPSNMLTTGELADIFENEAKRVRGILR